MIPTKQQRATRARAITLRVNTDAWIIPRALIEAIDKEHWRKAKRMLEEQRQIWPNDPEITYYDSLIFSTQVINRSVRGKKRQKSS